MERKENRSRDGYVLQRAGGPKDSYREDECHSCEGVISQQMCNT